MPGRSARLTCCNGSKPNRPEPVAPTQINVPCCGLDKYLISTACAELFVSGTPGRYSMDKVINQLSHPDGC